ncbi:MAG: hypothetical protein FD167_4770 [bacterium]|nr:MAG: hypothetical protein FD167_4770 [bacterium]
MLLTLLALLHSQIGTLPSRRVDIYRLCVGTLVEAIVLPYSMVERVDKKGLIGLFAYIAYSMQETNEWLIDRETLEIKALNFLKLSSDKNKVLTKNVVQIFTEPIGIIVEQSPNLFSFIHLNLQEYLAAHYLANWASKACRMNSLEKYLPSWDWLNIFFLTACSLDSQEADEFIEQILNTHLKFDNFFDNLAELKQAELDKEKVEQILFSLVDLLLAGYCVKEDTFISLSLKSKIQDALVKLWNEMFDIPFQNIVIADSYITRDYIIGSLLDLLESPAFNTAS